MHNILTSPENTDFDQKYFVSNIWVYCESLTKTLKLFQCLNICEPWLVCQCQCSYFNILNTRVANVNKFAYVSNTCSWTP